MIDSRKDRREYYLGILEAVRQRSTCDRGKAGAIIVKDGRLMATGYVGSPAGAAHCDEKGHMLVTYKDYDGEESIHCIRTVHAELNAILQAAKFGIAVRDSIMYCTMTPCYECAKAIINVGIKKVIAQYPYQSQKRTLLLFRKIGIELLILNKKPLEY